MGHNEDDWGDLVVNFYKVPPKDHQPNEKVTLLDGTKIPQVPHTFGYLWWETTNQKFGDYYLNEKGVSICSNACSSREDTATGNIGYYLRRIIAERASTAKEGVHIAADIISKIGYESSGRTYTIADPNEIWILAVVKGRHWIAEKVPDNQVAIIPNYYTIETVDLHDTVNVLASPDIISYAILRGWYFPQSDGAFNFKQTYGNTSNTFSFGNVPRHWAGINALANKSYGINDDLPFSFLPKSSVTVKSVQAVLSSHYEGTDFETNYSLHKNPHRNLIHRICNAGTKFSTVTQLYNDRPAANGFIVWWAPLNPCIHPYIPIAYGINQIPATYQIRPLEQALANHFDKKANSFKANPKSAYATFKNYNDQIDQDYKAKITEAKQWKQSFEEKVINAVNAESIKKDEQLGQVSATFLQMLFEAEKEKIK
ncbi:MAG: hypothetical protein DRP35_11075 [Candidatus Zixiibacteriota bacterium]|nr:MAG: hypothetical protein DRP35_11075 [candidate division Zixibacteria bacterium]